MHYFSEKANLKKMNVNVNPYSFPYFATWQPLIYISHIFQFIRLRVVASTDLSIVVSSTHVHFDHLFLILADEWRLSVRPFVRHTCLVVPLVSSCLRVLSCVHVRFCLQHFVTLHVFFFLSRTTCTSSLDTGKFLLDLLLPRSRHREIR